MTDIASLQIQANSNDVVAAVRRLLELERATRATERALRAQRREMELGSRAVDRMARNMQFLSRTMTSVAAGLLGVSAIRNAIGVMASYQRALVGIAKTTNSTAEETKVLDDRFKRLALTMAVPVNELLNYGRIAGQLGVRGTENIAKFAKTMGQLSIATQDIKGEAGALQLSKLINLTKTAPSDVDKLGAALVQLGNTVGATEGSILRTSTFLGASLAPFKVGVKDVLGFSGAIAALGQRAETAATAFYKVFGLMGEAAAKGGEDLRKFALISGMSMEEFAATFNAAPRDAFLAFLKGSKQSTDAGALFNVIMEQIGLQADESARPLAALASNLALVDKSLINSAEGYDRQKAAAEESARASDTLWGSIERLQNAYRLLIVFAGEAGLGKAIRGTIDVLREVLIIFGGMTGYVDSVSASGRFFATVIGSIGLALAGLALGRFISMLIATVNAFRLTAAAAASLNVTLRANPIVAILGLIGSLVGALYAAEAAYEETSEAAKKFNKIRRDGEDRASRIREIKLDLAFADKTGNVEKRIEAINKQLTELQMIGTELSSKDYFSDILGGADLGTLPDNTIWALALKQVQDLGVALDGLRDKGQRDFATGNVIRPAAGITLPRELGGGVDQRTINAAAFTGTPISGIPGLGIKEDAATTQEAIVARVGKRVEELRKQLAELATTGKAVDLTKSFSEGQEAADKFISKLREQTAVMRASLVSDLEAKLEEARNRANAAVDDEPIADKQAFIRLVEEEIRKQYELAEAIKGREDLLKTLEDEKQAYYEAVAGLDEYAAKLEDEIKLLGMSKQAREVEAQVMEAEAIARKGDVELTKEQIEYIRLLAETKQALDVKKNRTPSSLESLEQLDRELMLLGENVATREAINMTARIKGQLEQDGIPFSQEQLDTLQGQLKTYYKLLQVVEGLRAVGQDFGLAIADGIKTAVQEGGKLRDFIASIYDRLWQSAFDQFVGGFLQDMMGQLFAAIGLTMGTAGAKLTGSSTSAAAILKAGGEAAGAALVRNATAAAAIMAGGRAASAAGTAGTSGTDQGVPGASNGGMAGPGVTSPSPAVARMGGVWGPGGQITAYARGGLDRGLSASLASGVVSSPTMVPQALIGEGTRPEAIMPLDRTTNGQLAVMAMVDGRSVKLPIGRMGDGNMGVRFNTEAPEPFRSGGIVGGSTPGFGGALTRADMPAPGAPSAPGKASTVNVYQNITTPDPDAFRASQRQMATRTRRSMR